MFIFLSMKNVHMYLSYVGSSNEFPQSTSTDQETARREEKERKKEKIITSILRLFRKFTNAKGNIALRSAGGSPDGECWGCAGSKCDY